VSGDRNAELVDGLAVGILSYQPGILLIRDSERLKAAEFDESILGIVSEDDSRRRFGCKPIHPPAIALTDGQHTDRKRITTTRTLHGEPIDLNTVVIHRQRHVLLSHHRPNRGLILATPEETNRGESDRADGPTCSPERVRDASGCVRLQQGSNPQPANDAVGVVWLG
jgi:hypothetical protein